MTERENYSYGYYGQGSTGYANSKYEEITSDMGKAQTRLLKRWIRLDPSYYTRTCAAATLRRMKDQG